MARKSSSHEKSKVVTSKDGIAVHCKFDQLVPAAELKLYPGNYRKHKGKQLDAMHKVINGNGWRRSAVVSSLSGCVIKGNGMVQMAQRHGFEVPVEFQIYKTRREEIRDLVADNRLSALAEDDDDALRQLVSELDAGEIELAAVTSAEIEALIRDADIPEAEFPITAKLHESYDYVLVFTDNASDSVFLQTLLGLEVERSYKNKNVGLGRAIAFKRFLDQIRENRHSLDVQGQHHADPPPHSKRRSVRAKKPAKAV